MDSVLPEALAWLLIFFIICTVPEKCTGLLENELIHNRSYTNVMFDLDFWIVLGFVYVFLF